MNRLLLLIFVFFGSAISWSQPTPLEHSKEDLKYLIIVGDTVNGNSITLNEVSLLPRLKLNGSEERKRYYTLQYRVKKVYPYAKMASEYLKSMNQRLLTLRSKRAKKRYTKKIQKFLEDEFSAELKKLSIQKGNILIKLIHRQTGQTTFDLVKSLRTGWRAFWYNNTAKLFNMNLKTKYDPINVEEDYLIEDILQRLFQSGTLEPQDSYIKYDFYRLNDKWRPKKKNQNNK